MSLSISQQLALSPDLIELYTNGECSNLACEIHKQTSLPIVGIYDSLEKPCSWGIDYWHYFIKVKEDTYLDCRGLHVDNK